MAVTDLRPDPELSAPPGIGAGTLCAAFQRTLAAGPDAPALRAHGDETVLTRAEYARAVEEVAAGLADLGVRRGDTVGLMLTNRPEFHIVDTAALHLGAIPFSIYNTSSPEQIEYLVGHAENRVLVCEPQFFEAVTSARTPRLEHVVLVGSEGMAGTITLEQLRNRRPAGFDFESTWQSVQADDIATLIYTSGTTGPPKGVELTHANLMRVLDACHVRFPFRENGSAISYLPTAHVADRIFSHYLQMVTGYAVTTVRDASQVFAAVARTHPTWFLGVPRIWEKLRASLLDRFAEAPAAQRATFDSRFANALRKVRSEQRGEVVPDELAEECAAADESLFAPLRAQIGLDQVDLLMTGAAPIAPAVQEFFLALGMPLSEGFGMSETGALGMTNPPGGNRVGSVGTAMPGTDAKVAGDGELLLHGPHVMRGYRKDPDKTAEAIDADGWLHTGDVATIDDDGYVWIVDRKKELIINAAGKNISPANIESTLKSASPLIGEACALGDAQRYVVALIVLDVDAAATLAAQHGLSDRSVEAVAAHPAATAAVDEAVSRANAQLSRVEQVKRYRLLARQWVADGDELTPTFKLKRRAIQAKYATEIDALYT